MQWRWWRDRSARGLVLAMGSGVIASWILVISLFKRTELFLPLHYTIYFGIDLTGSWMKLLVLPSLATISAVFHCWLAGLVDDWRWARMWLLVGCLLQVFLVGSLVTLAVITRQRPL